jgi:hypothetical protein
MTYHVLHEGRRIGPYDRRTIVGLRIKKTLTGEHQLEAGDGTRLSVADLLGTRPTPSEFNPLRSGTFTSRLTCSGSMIDRQRGAAKIPLFRGEIELRLQSDVLRIAGKHRHGFGVKDGRVKLPLKDIVHSRLAGSRVDLWLRNGDAARPSLQRVGLDLFSHETARELVQALPDTQPWPEPAPAPAPAASPMLWVAAIGVTMVVGLVMLVVLRRHI